MMRLREPPLHLDLNLEERIRYLEGVNRFVLDALDTAATLGDFQGQINRQGDPAVIIAETRRRLRALIPFRGTAFYLVNDETREFEPFQIDPPAEEAFFRRATDQLIEEGTFAWALREKRPLIVPCPGVPKRLLLHVMATASQIHGMFIGILKPHEEKVNDISLSFLSLILLHSSNALETYSLYEQIGRIKEGLNGAKNYRNLFEAAPDGVEVLDQTGRLVDCNAMLLKMTGYGREKIMGAHPSLWCPEAGEENSSRFLAALKKEGEREAEVEFVNAQGDRIPVWRKERAFYDDEGRFLGVVVYNRDLSRLKKAEAERRELEARLQRAKRMEALGTLAGGVAHDLNNILSGLVSYPDLLLIRTPPGDPMRKPLEVIKKSGEKIAAIVQDLLTLGRRGVVQTGVVDLNAVVAEHLRSSEHERLCYYHRGVRFRTDLKEGLNNVSGSKFHLGKAVMNLLSNAAEAITGEGEVTITTRNVTLTGPLKALDRIPPGDYVVLTVADTGSGISQEDMERIFEPFYSKKVLGRSGTGLGMTVVWGICKDHGGHIDIRSLPGRGTEISLYLPATREKAAAEKAPIPPEAYQGKGEKILVVDDSPQQREIASEILEELGYRVVTAASGEEAVAYIKDHTVDLVLLDMIMDPGMDGLDTYREMIKVRPGQKAVIASGFSETERVRELHRLGVRQYIKKPYLMEQIGLAIRSELDGEGSP